jgi:nocardicin N-oxygenase
LDDLGQHEVVQMPQDFPAGALFTPSPTLLELQRTRPACPVRFPSGHSMWLLTRYRDVRSAFLDARLTRELGHPGAPRIAGDDVTSLTHSMFSLDAPRHTALRATLAPVFGRAEMPRWRCVFEQHITTLIDGFHGGPAAELVQALVEPLVAALSSGLLGLTGRQFRLVRSIVRRQSRIGGSEAMVGHATARLRNFAAGLVSGAGVVDGAGPLAAALLAGREAGSITTDEARDTMAMLLSTATDSTTGPLATGLLALLRHPAQRFALRDRPAWLAAADEVLRYYNNGPTNFPRLATSDLEIGGTRIVAGEAVITSALAAMWDPSYVPHPEIFDVAREVRTSLVFGVGHHRCLAAAFVRELIACTLQIVFTRLPRLRLTVDAHQLPGAHGGFFVRPLALPVAW